MTRLSTRLNEIKSRGAKALIAYIVAGDPEPDVTVDLMHHMVASGVDVIEMGMPFSDPEAEGPVIQLAHERALAHSISLNDCLEMVAEFRQQDQQTPIVLMGYLNPVEIMGYEKFAAKASEAGVNGTIIVNLPPEESGELSGLLEEKGIETVYLLAPTTTDARAAVVCQAARGFVYYVSLKGTTGAATLDAADVAEKVSRFRKYTELPIMVGFGVKDGATAKAVVEVADGVAVGTAIVRIMESCAGDKNKLISKVGLLIAELRTALSERGQP